MDANLYMDEIVDPTIADFEANPASRRHAFLACVVTFHTIDYLAYPDPSRSLRQQFRSNADFAVVDRVAHASKHVETDGIASSVPPPLRAAEVIARPPALYDVGVYDLSRYDDADGGVQTKISPDDLLPVVKRAAEFLRTQL